MAVNAGAGECYGRRKTENLISDADAAGESGDGGVAFLFGEDDTELKVSV